MNYTAEQILDELKNRPNSKVSELANASILAAVKKNPKTSNTITSCLRCNGSGRYPSVHYNGVCLRCNGSGRCDKIHRVIYTPIQFVESGFVTRSLLSGINRKIANYNAKLAAAKIEAENTATNTPLGFGKYSTKTFAEVAEMDYDYAQWVVDNSYTKTQLDIEVNTLRRKLLEPYKAQREAEAKKELKKAQVKALARTAVGHVGEKVTLKVKLIKQYDNYNYDAVVRTFETEEGNMVVCWNGRKAFHDIAVGWEGTITATVKKIQNDYRDNGIQTVITRPKVVA